MIRQLLSSTTYVKNGDAVNVSATYSDANLDENSALTYFKADLSALGGSASANATGTNATKAWWLVGSVSGTGNGTVTVTVNVTDPSGNYNNTESDTITADNAAPTLSYAVLDADNDGTNYTYVDVYFSETTMDTSTIAYTDFNISDTGVDTAALQNASGNRATLRLDDILRTGGSPTVGVDGSVADLAGNTLSSGTITVNTYRISLSSSWNLISIPADASGDLISTVVTDISS